MSGAPAAWAQVQLSVVSVSPSRPHLVAAGTGTTFVLSVQNTAGSAASVTLSIQAPSSWQGLLAGADAVFRPVGAGVPQLTTSIPARQALFFVAQLSAGGNVAEGATATATVTATVQGALQGTVPLNARLRNHPKIFYVALDGAGAGYLALDKHGNHYDGSVPRLMPRANEFNARAAVLTNASGLLPSTTDGNHASALSGSWPGTLGLFSVKRQYLGDDASGRAEVVDGSKGLMRWGLDGEPIQTMFDLSRNPAAGGDPGAFNAIVSGKQWLADLFQDPATLDLAVGGQTFPSYVPAPQPYRLGDPPSDDNPVEDREGTNLGPWAIEKLYSAQALYAGSNPARTPSDRWVAEAVLRLIAAEDPDVLYVNLAECDTVQHIFGSADKPEEWTDPGTPNILWDDVNVYNAAANRDPVLDTVFEADYDFGLIMDMLSARGVLDRSYLTLLSDHGVATVMHTHETVLDVARILRAAGVPKNASQRLVTSGEMGWIVLKDPSMAPQIEAILQQHVENDPVLKTPVHPFIVLNRAEMDSGVDDVEGPMAADGISGNLRGELYSEWSIDGTDTSVPKVRWPDLFIFTRFNYQNTLIRSNDISPSRSGSPFNGHHGSRGTSHVILSVSGPGLRPGAYGDVATLADLAPTLYRLLGIAPPGHVDGKPLLGVLAP
jgi:predicted AlkP superfamily pyrophosphatase or phosphodiesterase